MGVVLPTTKKNAKTTDIYIEGVAREIGNTLLGKNFLHYVQCSFPCLPLCAFPVVFRVFEFMCMLHHNTQEVTGCHDWVG